MSLFIPATEGFLAALDRVTHARWLRIKVDTTEDGIPDTELTTTAAGWCNRASGSGKMEGSNNECVTNTWRFQLRNANKMYAEGDYANAAATVETKVGAGNEYITMFTGYVSDAGAERIMGARNDDYVSFTLVDDFKMRAANRKCESVFLVNYKILDTATPANSIFHVLAGYLGLEAGDLDVATIDYVKDFVGFDKKKDVLKELQDLASAYLGLLTFRYDGKLRLLSRFQTGYSEPSSEWTFNDDNITVSFSSVVSSILCNRVKTEYESRETLSARVVHKNVTGYDTETGKCSIAVSAGEYWPGPGDGDVGILSFVDPNSGEEWDTATERVQPTIGATGGGSDIESTGGVLTLESWEGAAGTNPAKTSAEYKGAQIILYNGTAGTVTITKLQIRGQPVRIDKLNRVEDIDSTITDDWNYRDKTIPGKFMANVDQAHETLNWWRQQGEAKRRAFKFSTYYFPIIQEGAIITVGSAGHEVEEIAARVLEYQHHCTGPVATWSTSIVAREWAAFTPSDEPYVEQEERPSDTPTVTEKFDNMVTTTTIIDGFTTGGGTKTPTQPTILYCEPVGVGGIQLQWDKQLNLTNLSHYELQVSGDAGTHVYELRFDGVDWKGDENENTDWPTEFIVHPHIPFGGTEEAPEGVQLWYRVRRVTKEPVESAWSDWATAVTSTIGTGVIAENAITLNKLAAAVISVMLLKAEEIYIGFHTNGAGTLDNPEEGDTVIYMTLMSIEFREYTGGDWVTTNSIKIGGFLTGLFLNMIGCGGMYHPANPPVSAEMLPNPYFRVFNFENNYADQNGLDDWTTKTNTAFDATIKKFGVYSLTATEGNYGYIYGPGGGIIGSDQAFGGWYRLDRSGTSTGFSIQKNMFNLTNVGTGDSLALNWKGVIGTIPDIRLAIVKGGVIILNNVTVCDAPTGWFYAAIAYKANTDTVYVIINNTIYTYTNLGGSWGAGTWTHADISVYKNVTQDSLTFSGYADEFLYYFDKYLDPNILAQHYTHNVAWDSSGVSKADIIARPNTDGRLMIANNVGTYPMGLKTIDSAVLAQNQVQTLPHGLGARPSRVHTSLLCVTAEYGFVAGDEIFDIPNYYDAPNYRIWQVDADATNIRTVINDIVIYRRDAAGWILITPSSWKFRIRCGI